MLPSLAKLSRREAIGILGAGLVAGSSGCKNRTSIQSSESKTPEELLEEARSTTAPDVVWGRIGLADGRFQKPRAMTIDAKGNIYVVDKTGRIQVFDPNGEFQHLWHTPAIETGKPTGLGIDNEGNIMVADTHYFRILFYRPDGTRLEKKTIGGTNGPQEGQFAFVTDAVQDSLGNFYISEYGEFDRIQKYDSNGKFIRRFGETGESVGQYLRPQCMMFDSEKNLWVTDSCNHRIQVFRCNNDQLEWVKTIGGPGEQLGQFRYPYGLWLSTDSMVYVAEFGNHRVQKLTLDGKPIATWGTPGKLPGQLNQPWAVVGDSKNRIYVLDTGNNRVQRVQF